MTIPKNAGHGNTFTEVHIDSVGTYWAQSAKPIETYFINGRKVTKEEYENYSANNV